MSTQKREEENQKWVAVQKKAFTHWVNRQVSSIVWALSND
jgi:hypothetical protein